MNVAVLGVADESSIGWAIARAFQARGDRVVVGYQQKFFSRVRLLLKACPAVDGARCDVLSDDEMAAFFGRFEDGGLDVLVHAVAFGPPAVFTQPPSEATAADFNQTLDVSAHSLLRAVHHARPFLRDGASVIALSFQAARRAEPFYGVMGVAKAALESIVRYLAVELGPRRIRVNAISPGPIETLSALGIVASLLQSPAALERLPSPLLREAAAAAGTLDDVDDALTRAQAVWKRVQEAYARRSPIPEPVTQDDVADCALFLGGPHARKITGQVLHVDCGFSSAMML